jgi:hypothetical protein
MESRELLLRPRVKTSNWNQTTPLEQRFVPGDGFADYGIFGKIGDPDEATRSEDTPEQ